MAPASVCLTHKVTLGHVCPHCQKSNVRNRASVVVPGYCTACGGFLGDAETDPAAPEALWVARQIESMLSSPTVLNENESLAEFLSEVISRMGGNVTRFARRLDLSKSGVWYWTNKGGLPTIHAWLAISLHGGIGLDRLLRRDIDGWVPPAEPPQLALDLPSAPRKGKASRKLDWELITCQMRAILREEVPVSLEEASARLGLHSKQLNLRTTAEARAITERFQQYRAQRKQQREDALKKHVGELLAARVDAGYSGMSVRDLRKEIDGTSMGNVRHAFSIVKQVRDGMN